MGVGVAALLLGGIVGGVTGHSMRNAEIASIQSDAKAEVDAGAADARKRIDKAFASVDEKTNRNVERAQELDVLESDLDAREKALDEREAKIAGAEKKQAENQFGSGVLVVGKNVSAGTYSTNVSSGMCYYAWKSGTGSDASIVGNNIVESGPATVTLEDGQVFESRSCGTWTKQ